MIVYATYYANIERACYNPSKVIETWKHCDRRMVFVSTAEDARIIKDIDADVLMLDKQLDRPADIPVLQNMCVDECYKSGAEYVVYIHGDQYVTERGDEWIYNYIDTNDDPWCMLPSMTVQLYSKLWEQWPVTVSNAKHPAIYDVAGDGGASNVNSWKMSGTNIILDLGYLGTPQYYGKMRNHKHLWPNKYKNVWLELWNVVSHEAAIRIAYNAIMTSKMRPLEPIDFELYHYVIDSMHQMDDYKFCTDILRSMQ